MDTLIIPGKSPCRRRWSILWCASPPQILRRFWISHGKLAKKIEICFIPVGNRLLKYATSALRPKKIDRGGEVWNKSGWNCFKLLFHFLVFVLMPRILKGTFLQEWTKPLFVSLVFHVLSITTRIQLKNSEIENLG